MNRKWIYYLGNTFLITSVLGFFVILSPVLLTYFLPSPVLDATVKKEFSISIPKIKAQARIIENIDPWNESVYKEALKHGIAHAKGTALPGQKGTVYLFAHSSGMPWELTGYNTVFLRLGELSYGDTTTITYNSKAYAYQVVNKKEVWPTEVRYLKHVSKDQLVLQTCTPIGTTLKRLLVFAEPIRNKENE